MEVHCGAIKCSSYTTACNYFFKRWLKVSFPGMNPFIFCFLSKAWRQFLFFWNTGACNYLSHNPHWCFLRLELAIQEDKLLMFSIKWNSTSNRESRVIARHSPSPARDLPNIGFIIISQTACRRHLTIHLSIWQLGSMLAFCLIGLLGCSLWRFKGFGKEWWHLPCRNVASVA